MDRKVFDKSPIVPDRPEVDLVNRSSQSWTAQSEAAPRLRDWDANLFSNRK
jgi:hypothetical protein